MANLFIHKLPISNGVKFTLICSNDIAKTIEEFLGDCFELEVLKTGKKTVLRSETRFEIDIEDNEKISKLSKAFSSLDNINQSLFGIVDERNFPEELLKNICVN